MSEVETAFIIHSTKHDEIFDVIDKLIISEGYIAKKNGIQIIHDTYFDTKDEILKKMRLHYVLEKLMNKLLKLL